MSASIITKINPINKETERLKFLFDSQYNPQFEYVEKIRPDEYVAYGHISDRYVDIAKSILDAVIKKYGSEEDFIKAAEGETMTQDEVEAQIHEYLKLNKIEGQLKIIYSRKFIARTSVQQDDMRVRLPIDYGKDNFKGVLDHEIGTHYFRTLNDRLSPWHKNRKEFGMTSYIETEEGLAVLHHQRGLSDPFLWRQALYYYVSWLGNRMSFAELAKELEVYIKTPERRWKTCLRVKRGLNDTSQPGAFSRDQLYLSGVIKVLHYLEEHEYNPEPLYAGKVDTLDVKKARELNGDRKYLLPHFLQGDYKEEYKKSLLKIKKLNFAQA